MMEMESELFCILHDYAVFVLSLILFQGCIALWIFNAKCKENEIEKFQKFQIPNKESYRQKNGKINELFLDIRPSTYLLRQTATLIIQGLNATRSVQHNCSCKNA